MINKLKNLWIVLLIIPTFFSLISVPDINALNLDHTLGAHRGSSVNYTENTIEAFEKALKDEKYKFIEFDIQYTKDRKVIVFHDLSLYRLQDKKNKIKDLTYQELNEISDYKIPLYEEVMDKIEGKKKLNIEIKSQGFLKDDKQLVDWVVKDLKKRNLLQTTLLSSISRDVVKYIKEKHNLLAGQIFWIVPSTYFQMDYLTQKLYENVEETGADYIMLHGSNLRNYEALSRLKPKRINLVFWYFDDSMYVMQGSEW
jgi:glycerophosphoryl diester phosphodiesterase